MWWRAISNTKDKMDTKVFISRAISKHGEKYIYDDTMYLDYYTKVDILCPIHGKWQQLPNNHLKGSGCPKCGYEKLSANFSSDTDSFITKASQIHGDLYNYDGVNYINTHKKVEVICNIHGSWMVTPPTI